MERLDPPQFYERECLSCGDYVVFTEDNAKVVSYTNSLNKKFKHATYKHKECKTWGMIFGNDAFFDMLDYLPHEEYEFASEQIVKMYNRLKGIEQPLYQPLTDEEQQEVDTLHEALRRDLYTVEDFENGTS